MASKIQRILLRAAAVFFGLLMAAILVATLLLDKNLPDNPFPNMAKWSNGGYYFFAFLGLIFLLFIWTKLREKQTYMSERTFYVLIGCIAALTIVLQLPVSNWAPILTPNNGDFGSVREMAVNLSEGGSFEGVGYFRSAHNNVNIAILLSWVYRVLPMRGDVKSYGAFVFAGALMTNISVVLMTLSVYRLTRSKLASLVMCILGGSLIALSWRAYMPYTDCWGMPFAIGAVYLYLSNVRKEIKIPGIMILGLIGAWIKVTALIPLIGIIIYSALQMTLPSIQVLKTFKFDKNIFFRNFLPYVFCLIMILGGGSLSAFLQTHYGYAKTESSKGWQ